MICKKHSKTISDQMKVRQHTRRKSRREEERQGKGKGHDGSSFSEPEVRVLTSNRVKRRRCGGGGGGAL